MKFFRILAAFLALASLVHGQGTPTFTSVNGLTISTGTNTFTLTRGTSTLTLATAGATNLGALSTLATTKGDLAVYNGTGWVRVGAGTNDYVLTADSAQAAGVKWAVGGGGLTIGSTAITGGTSGRLLTSGATVGELTLGANVLTALGVAVGTDGAFITRGGNAGTPSAIVLTNATSIPAGQLTGTIADARNTVSNTTTTSMANLATVGTLTGGATGAGFTVALSTSTITGSLADARLSANVPLKDGANTFTGTTNTFTLPTTTGTTTTSGIAVAGNSLTTGTGLYAASSSLTSGKLMDLQVSGTAAAANQTALNVATAGANGTSAITTIGAAVANTHTGTTSVNIGGKFTATGGATNYALDLVATTDSSGAIFRASSAYGSNIAFVLGSNTYGFVGYSPAAASGSILFTSGGGSASTISTIGVGSLQFPAGTFTGAVTAQTTLAVTGNTTITGNLTSNGAFISTPEALAPALNAGSAVGVTTLTSTIAVNGTNAITLANGTNGQIKTVVCTAVTAAGTATVTPTTANGFVSFAFTAAGQSVTLQYFTSGGWVILSVRNATIAAHWHASEQLALCA